VLLKLSLGLHKQVNHVSKIELDEEQDENEVENEDDEQDKTKLQECILEAS